MMMKEKMMLMLEMNSQLIKTFSTKMSLPEKKTVRMKMMRKKKVLRIMNEILECEG